MLSIICHWENAKHYNLLECLKYKKKKNPPNQKTNKQTNKPTPNLTIPILGKYLEQYTLAFAAGGNEKMVQSRNCIL